MLEKEIRDLILYSPSLNTLSMVTSFSAMPAVAQCLTHESRDLSGCWRWHNVVQRAFQPRTLGRLAIATLRPANECRFLSAFQDRHAGFSLVQLIAATVSPLQLKRDFKLSRRR